MISSLDSIKYVADSRCLNLDDTIPRELDQASLQVLVVSTS